MQQFPLKLKVGLIYYIRLSLSLASKSWLDISINTFTFLMIVVYIFQVATPQHKTPLPFTNCLLFPKINNELSTSLQY